MFGVGCVYGRNDDRRFGFFCHSALEFLLQSGSSPVSFVCTFGVILDFHVLGIHAVHIVVRKVCISRSILCYFQYLNLIH